MSFGYLALSRAKSCLRSRSAWFGWIFLHYIYSASLDVRSELLVLPGANHPKCDGQDSHKAQDEEFGPRPQARRTSAEAIGPPQNRQPTNIRASRISSSFRNRRCTETSFSCFFSREVAARGTGKYFPSRNSILPLLHRFWPQPLKFDFGGKGNDVVLGRLVPDFLEQPFCTRSVTYLFMKGIEILTTQIFRPAKAG